jgi:predicted methyltransferase MtxX (methanogen marker protein 4)
LVGVNIPQTTDLDIINTSNPEETLIDLMLAKKVDGIVRGSFQANTTLRALKTKLNGTTSLPHIRIALIQNSLSDNAVFLSPVGIEEGKDFNSKKIAISNGVELLELLGVKLKVNILAAGLYPDDLGRDSYADETIRTTTELINFFEAFKKIKIKTSGILIEEALAEGANLIIAPDGISGNLLYRTLVHVADWKSFGAVLSLQHSKFSDFVYIDTSRIGTVHEYRRAIVFASALAGLSKNK